MNERKQHVIQKANRLFIEKGFQATSIQDILDISGISKGTFYNYFPSKSELFKDVFTFIRSNYEKERNELLLGQDLADMEVFIKQVDLFMKSNKKNKLFALIEEVIVSNDPELKEFIKLHQLKTISWTYTRFLHLFGEEKKPYLLDCAIIFSGLLHHTFHYNLIDKGANLNQLQIIRYCVDRIKNIVADVSEAKIQLLDPSILNTWMPDPADKVIMALTELHRLFISIRKQLDNELQNDASSKKYIQLLDFIQEEMMHSKKARYFLIESSLLSLKTCSKLQGTEEFERFSILLTEHVLNG